MKSFSLALVLLLGLALTGCGWNPFHKMYSATAEIQIKPMKSDFREMPSASAQIATHIGFMQSPDNLTPIIQKSKLDRIWAKRLKSDHDVLSPQEAMDHLRKVLKIEAIPGTNFVKVTASSEAPQEAADIANGIVDEYKALLDYQEAVRNKRGLDALRDWVTQQQKVVDDKSAAVMKMLHDLPDRGNQQLPDLPGLRADCDRMESDIDKLLKDGFTEDHPRIISLRTELALKRQQLTDLLKAEAATPKSDARFSQEIRDLNQQQSLLDALNVRLKQVITDPQLAQSPVRTVSRAVAPPE